MSTDSSTIELDLTPEPHTLLGQSNTTLGWRRCLGELIDNAFDAGADSVQIEHSSKTLTVSDNGRGSSDISAFFRMGSHRSRGGIGAYGVGLKDAAVWLWGSTQVTTTHKRRTYSASVNWEHIVKSNNWRMVGSEAAATSPDGTVIRFSNIRRQMNDRDKLLDDLGYTFCPAIEQGRQIVFVVKGKRQPIQAFKMPPLESVVDAASEIDGKPFRVVAGVVKEGHKNTRPGFSIAYKHRIITNTSEGCGTLGTARFAGMVHLGEGWQLSRNKDELVDDAGLLAETLYGLCADPLQQASQQSMCVELAGMEQEISDALQDAMQEHIRSKRNSRSGGTGTVEPKGTTRTQKRAPVNQAGEKRLLAKIGNNIRVQFVEGLPVIGQAEFNASGTLISLNSDEPYVQWAKSEKDRNGLVALAAAILAIEASNITDEKQRHRLLPEIDDGEIRSRFLAGLSLYTKHVGSKTP